MIDWWWIASNAMWIIGCALALAVFSYADYVANVRAEKMRQVLRQPAMKSALLLAALLFCAGLAATASAWWEAIIWIGLGLFALVQWARDKRSPKV